MVGGGGVEPVPVDGTPLGEKDPPLQMAGDCGLLLLTTRGGEEMESYCVNGGEEKITVSE